MRKHLQVALALAISAAFTSFAFAQGGDKEAAAEGDQSAAGKQPVTKSLGLAPGSNRPRPAAPPAESEPVLKNKSTFKSTTGNEAGAQSAPGAAATETVGAVQSGGVGANGQQFYFNPTELTVNKSNSSAHTQNTAKPPATPKPAPVPRYVLTPAWPSKVETGPKPVLQPAPAPPQPVKVERAVRPIQQPQPMRQMHR